MIQVKWRGEGLDELRRVRMARVWSSQVERGWTTSSSISNLVKPPYLGSSDGIGGGVWPSVIAMSLGDPVVMLIASPSSEDIELVWVEAEFGN